MVCRSFIGQQMGKVGPHYHMLCRLQSNSEVGRCGTSPWKFQSLPSRWISDQPSCTCESHTRFFTGMCFIKNVWTEICREFKNVITMFWGSNSYQHRNLSMNSYRIWCLLLMLDFYVKAILNTALYTSLYHYRCINIHIPLSICCLYLQTEIGSPSILFAVYTYPRKLRFLLRMCWECLRLISGKNIRMLSLGEKIHHSYKKKRVIVKIRNL